MVERKVKREKEIPESKTKTVEELLKLIKTSNSLVIVSIKNLPDNQFQAIKKKLRQDAKIMVVKKSIAGKAIDDSGSPGLKSFKKNLKEDTALIFSNLDPFELSAILSRNKSKSRAKIGQIVEDDVVIEPGPTELVPGPVISELSGVGIKFAIEDGKITIRDKKVILKKNDVVTEQAAGIMAKFDMKPVSVGLEPLIAYEIKTGKVYEDIKIDQTKEVESMKKAAGRALALAVKLAYPCKQTISYLLAKAKSYEQALGKLIKTREEK